MVRREKPGVAFAHRGALLVAALALACGHHGGGASSGGGGNGGLVGLDGEGQAPNVDFGSVPVGQSVQKTLTVSNPGTASITLSGLTFGGQDPRDFIQQGAIAQRTLAPGSHLDLTLVFTPAAAGSRSATLLLTFEGAGSLTSLLQGVGIAMSVSASPNPVDFGTVQLGTPPPSLEVQLQNAGNTAVQTQLQPITGPQASFFSASGNGSLPAGGSLTALVTFTPTVTGAASATLPIQFCDPSGVLGCATFTLPLQGTAVDSQLAFTPDPLDFGPVPAGQAGSNPVTLTNEGSADVTLNSLATGSGSSAVFALQGLPAFPVDLPAGQSLGFTVQYTPSGAAGGDSDSLVAAYVVSGAVSRTASDPLVGNGVLTPCQLTLTPTALAFGTVSVGTQAKELLTLGNTGETTCNVTGLQLAAGSDPAFTLPAGAPTSLAVAPAGSATVEVDFLVAAAIAPLSRRGSLTFQSDDPNQPQLSVPLTATLDSQDFPCTLTVAPASLSWGTVAAGTPAPESVTVTNGGYATCQVSAIQLNTRTTDVDFALPPISPFSLAPGQSNPIQVLFDSPSSNPPYNHTGDLLFQTTDPTQPNVDVPLDAVVQKPTPYSPGWPKWHMDNADTGLSTADTSNFGGALQWKFPVTVPTSLSYLNSPVIDGQGNVYQLDMNGTFYKIDKTGKQVWTATLETPSSDPHPSTAIIAKDGTIFISGGEGGTLYHVSAAGAIIGQVATVAGADGFDVCPSLTNGGLLMDGDDEGPCEVFDPTQATPPVVNSLNVNFGFPEAERVGLAVGPDDTSYWVATDTLAAVAPPGAGGFTLKYQVAPAADFAATSCLADVALDVNNTGNLFVGVATSANSAGSAQLELLSINPANGAVVWSQHLPQGTLPSGNLWGGDLGNSSPAIGADGTVYVGNLDGLYAYDGATGATKAGFPFKTTSDVDSAVAIGGDGTLFFGTFDGTFYAVNPNGTQGFSYKTGGRITSSPAIGPDGTVVFVSDDGNIYAFK